MARGGRPERWRLGCRDGQGQVGPWGAFQDHPRRTAAHLRPSATGQQIVWENTGEIGSRVNPSMLEFDAGRPFLVTMAQAPTDYDGFGCPTPPYIVFRYDAGTWVRVPLAELPSRFVRMNLYPNPNPDR